MSAGAEATGPEKGQGLRLWAPLALGATLAFAGLGWTASHLIFDPETAAAEAHSATLFGEVEGRRVHCRDRRDSDRCVAGYRAAGSPPAVLWLGNSQLHRINRRAAGQETASQQLHRTLAARGRYLVTYSQPNANLAEHRLLYRRLRGDYRIETMVLAVCLDDFRESEVRETISGERAAKVPESASLQPRVESRLSESLGERWSLWRLRPKLKVLADYAAYTARNRLLGVTAQTKRPVPADLYAQKMALLTQIVAEARADGVQVVLYAPPYRRDVEGPYVESQYRRFIGDLETLRGKGVRVADLTGAVSGREWGMMRDPLTGTDDYDFMHFTAEGHRRLARGVAGLL